jgi:uncharacterized protein (TIGR03382 family)
MWGLAFAFCGFFVGAADATMFNDATQVVLLRQGTHTVLSMENHYQGPAKDFAMVVPVPVVLKEEQVKTLSADVFDRVDLLGSPRLVEYWERDPCYDYGDEVEGDLPNPASDMVSARDFGGGGPSGHDYGVTVEATFAVGEYQIVILSATESTGLDAWLRDQKYAIPANAEPLLRPYVESGSKFFVAKVDPAKVTFKDGAAMLSPLRFDYDSDDFSLPVRLGLANSSGTQDLIVNIVAHDRYEVGNYDNVFIPTNLEVKDEVRDRFAEFYAALFDRTLEVHPRAVVTEYAWQASSCDPCVGPPLSDADYATLGGDVLATLPPEDDYHNYGMVLTRLHARYTAADMKDDLVFRKGEPVVGGREVPNDWNNLVEEGATPWQFNSFQARYAIRHHWTGPMHCDSPDRGVWIGPPEGTPEPAPRGAADLAFAPRGKVSLPALLAEDVPELRLRATRSGSRSGHGCGCTSSSGTATAPLALLAALLLLRRRR